MLSRKRRTTEEARRLKPLQEKLAQGGLLEGSKLLTNPKGEVKMSDVIEEFMEPYRGLAHNLQEYKNLLALVILAWNASFFDEAKREEMFAQMTGSQILLQENQEEFRKFFNELLERKQRYFADNHRKIVEFDVKDLGDEFYFSVASTLE